MSQVDILVAGSGAAGLTAALTAALSGCRVMVLEKEHRVGGMTAGSGGAAWIPCNPHMSAAEVSDTPQAARTYIAAHLGNLMDDTMVDAFLRNGPAMIAFLEAQSTAVRFQSYPGPDYQQNLPGAFPRARSVMPLPFEGRKLGPWLDRMAGPKRELTVFGGMQVEASEAVELQRSWREWPAFRTAARLIGRYATDLLRFGRGTRMIRGQALTGRLLRSSIDAGVDIRTDATVEKLIWHGNRVSGVVASIGGRRHELSASHGVILATGGFSGLAELVAEHFPDAEHHISMFPRGNSGDGLRMALQAGATLQTGNDDNGIWMPASRRVHRNGQVDLYPHFAFDRCKPGAVVVGPDGKRFVNEGASYHSFVRAMRAAGAIPAWLIGDHPFLRRYGMGMARPFPYPYRSAVKDGYLVEGRTLADLAERIGVPAAALEETIAQMNLFARTGHDEVFGKGDDLHSKMLGDPEHGPNPTLGPIATAPFYALALYPSDAGSTLGLRTDADARVLGHGGDAIPGLYACGLDMNSILRGHYPGAGTMIGPAMAFAFAAARHASGTNTP